MKIFHTEIAVLIGDLFRLERCGRYEEALAELRDIWEDTSKLPEVNEFDSQTAAEILLRCGALIGFYGHNKQIPDSQENSKNLLTEAHLRFETINEAGKIAECENYLALAYWRTGELVEAESWINESLSHNISRFSHTRLYSYIIKCLISLPAKKYVEIAANLKDLEYDFINCNENCLIGDFYNHYGLALKNLGETSKALEKLELARFFHQKSQHQIYLGTVENNLSQLYKNERRFIDAHKAIDNAAKIFKSEKDFTREGFSLDTKAQIYCVEGKFINALKVIEKAIKILTKSENADYLVETILSKAKILLYLDDLTAGFMCLSDAVQIAKTKISEDRATALIKEYQIALDEKNSPVINKVFTEKEVVEEKIELILHPSISHYEEFQGIWIRNSHLENFGLRKGSLAVVIKDKIKRGDLVAISENADGSVLCGFYDADFGIICLEGISEEPQLFDENDITILGKIIGVGNAHSKSSGKINVEPLKF